MDYDTDATLSEINRMITNDDQHRVETMIADQSATSLYWDDIVTELLCTAVERHWYKVIKFMFEGIPCLLTDDGHYQKMIFQRAIYYCNAYIIELVLKDDCKFTSNIDQDSYDELIDNAYNKLQALIRRSELDNQLENIMRLKQIMKCLLEYPHNRYNQHGIVLEYDKATMKVIVSSIDSFDINTMINYQTVLEIWINRKNESAKNGRQASKYIRMIMSSIIMYLIKRVAKMQTLKIRVSGQNIQAINSSLSYDLFKYKCDTEIKRMSEVGIVTDRFVSIYEIFINCDYCLSQYTENDRIRRYILSGSITIPLPIYGEDIVRSFIKSLNKQARLLAER